MTEIFVDSFAGGGGASLGIELATGHSPDIAINHDAEALAMHEANHPSSQHFCENVWAVDPVKACAGRPVGLAWFSPDCKHHSKAKGGKPRDAKIRGLAWVVHRWARTVKPRVILLENVEEFADWGPLDEHGHPKPAKRGHTFRNWLGKLKAAGYVVEMRELRACDYGAPTTRKRLFIIARCDGEAIVWPEPTHGQGRSHAWRTAAECIDWSIPCPSIFERSKPLAEKTLRRIARGIRKFVIDSGSPFIVPATHGDNAGGADARVHSIDQPLRTIITRGAPFSLVAPTLIQTGYGERNGQAPRSLDLHQPLGTVVGCGQKHALVSAFLAKHYGGHEGPGSSLSRPLSTVTTQDHHSLVTATLGVEDRSVDVRAFLARFEASASPLVKINGQTFAIVDIGMRMLQPPELARAQGFPDSYDIAPKIWRPNGGGKNRPIGLYPITKTAQIRMIGNSVCPPIAAALVAANYRTPVLSEVA